jgi:5-methylcytosine-specific restriction endonuclease McrA
VNESKACTQCKQVKPLIEFAKHNGAKSSKSGIRPACKTCETLSYKKYRNANRDKVRATKKAWTDKNKDKKAIWDANYRAANKEKIRQNWVAWYALNKDDQLAKGRVWRLENKELKSARDKKWQQENKAKVNANGKLWRTRHPEKAAQVAKNYRSANPEAGRLKASRRRAKKVANGVFLIKQSEAQKLLSMPCFYCGAGSEHLDHVIPIAKGGRHSIGNLVQSCQTCNLSKNAKTIMEWRVWQARVLRSNHN